MAEQNVRVPPPEKMVRGTVAHGRTVYKPDPTKRSIAGYDGEGKAIYQVAKVEFGPGTEVELPEGEMKRFRELGYIIDPDLKAPSASIEGPSVSYGS